uniref:Uncharacterized protein n=1 Tax=Anguilla anguilla TaxID=7936 RepID=A0A0E9WHX8_ANGAN
MMKLWLKIYPTFVFYKHWKNIFSNSMLCFNFLLGFWFIVLILSATLHFRAVFVKIVFKSVE